MIETKKPSHMLTLLGKSGRRHVLTFGNQPHCIMAARHWLANLHDIHPTDRWAADHHLDNLLAQSLDAGLDRLQADLAAINDPRPSDEPDDDDQELHHERWDGMS